MKAAILREVGDEHLDLCTDAETIDPGPNDVRIKITHSGICHSDVSAMNGTIPQGAPSVLGHEGAGIVEEVGKDVSRVAVGDHVIAVWSPPCGACDFCSKFHQPNLCQSVMMDATRPINTFTQGGEEIGAMARTGTFAEETVLPELGMVKIDDDIPLDVASLIGCGVMTGVGASINTAKITPGSSVVVFGAGGVGVSAIQGAKIAGAAEIVAVDLKTEKFERVKELGATHAVTPEELPDTMGEITGGHGFDFALECIGNPAVMRQAYDMTRRGGTCCIVGVGRLDEFVQFSAFELFYGEKNLVGSYYGGTDARVDFHRLLRLCEGGQLDLKSMIDRTLSFEEINEGIDACRSGDVIRQVVAF